MTIDESLSLNPNRFYYPLITYLTRGYLQPSNKYAKNAMEIVHESKYVGSNNLEIYFKPV